MEYTLYFKINKTDHANAFQEGYYPTINDFTYTSCQNTENIYEALDNAWLELSKIEETKSISSYEYIGVQMRNKQVFPSQTYLNMLYADSERVKNVMDIYSSFSKYKHEEINQHFHDAKTEQLERIATDMSTTGDIYNPKYFLEMESAKIILEKLKEEGRKEEAGQLYKIIDRMYYDSANFEDRLIDAINNGVLLDNDLSIYEHSIRLRWDLDNEYLICRKNGEPYNKELERDINSLARTIENGNTEYVMREINTMRDIRQISPYIGSMIRAKMFDAAEATILRLENINDYDVSDYVLYGLVKGKKYGALEHVTARKEEFSKTRIFNSILNSSVHENDFETAGYALRSGADYKEFKKDWKDLDYVKLVTEENKDFLNRLDQYYKDVIVPKQEKATPDMVRAL